MKYNVKCGRYVTKGGLVYRYSKGQDKLILCKPCYNKDGYLRLNTKMGMVSVHRLVYETFVGEIPQGYQIDHINTIRDDNRLENLRCVTRTENNNNPLTIKHKSDAHKGKTKSEFGEKFKEHFGITRCENVKLYHKELLWYYRHKVCSWE